MHYQLTNLIAGRLIRSSVAGAELKRSRMKNHRTHTLPLCYFLWSLPLLHIALINACIWLRGAACLLSGALPNWGRLGGPSLWGRLSLPSTWRCMVKGAAPSPTILWRRERGRNTKGTLPHLTEDCVAAIKCFQQFFPKRMVPMDRPVPSCLFLMDWKQCE